jgi:O-antigen ligase
MSPRISRIALTAGAGACLFVIAYRNGSYGSLQRAEIAAVACLAALAVVALRARLYRTWPVAALAGTLIGLTVWTALSLAWTESADQVVPHVVLLSIYTGLFLVVSYTTRRRDVGAWCDGFAIAIAAIGWVALLSRFFPVLFDTARPDFALLSGSAGRLGFPVGYWNGLGILLACGVPFLLRSALAARAGIPRQVLSVSALPVVGVVAYLASSRGAALTAFVVIAVYTALSGSRWPSAAAAALLGVAGSLLALAVVSSKEGLIDRTADVSPGNAPLVLVGVVLVCLLTGGLFALAERRLLREWQPSRQAATVVVVAVAVFVLALFVAIDVPARYEAFKRSPFAAESAVTSNRAHFLSSGSTGRWQLWGSALDEFRTAPLEGRGAGSFEAWWAEHGTLPVFVRNAHSLYLETLAELGLVGFVLLLAFLVGGLTVGVSLVRRTRPHARYQPAALVATLAGFAFAAAIDWVWQLPAIGAVAVACVALLAGAASEQTEGAPANPDPRAARAAAAVAALVLVPLLILAVVDTMAQLRLGGSVRAAARGDGAAAVSDAQSARALEPWSAKPLLRLALAEERFGSLAVARAAIDEAVRKDAADWRLRLIAARLQAKVGDVEAASRSLEAARALNPRSPLFDSSG